MMGNLNPAGRRKRSAMYLTTAIAALTTVSPAAAQQASAPSGDEIIVTANKRSDTILNIPQSVQAISGDELERLSATSFQDIVNKLSGVSGYSTGTGTSSFNIRGIESLAASPIDASTVGYYVDDVPLSRASSV